MKQVLAVAAALTVLTAATAPAASAGPSAKSLQAQITSLRKELAATKKQVTTLQKKLNSTADTSDAALLAGVMGICGLAVTADALQGTWTTINGLAQAANQPVIFPAQSPVDDSGLCASAIRIPRSQTVPPNVSVFSAILNILTARTVFPEPWWQQPIWR